MGTCLLSEVNTEQRELGSNVLQEFEGTSSLQTTHMDVFPFSLALVCTPGLNKSKISK